MSKEEKKKAEVEATPIVDPIDAFIARRLKSINEIPNAALRKTLAHNVLLNRKGK